MEAVRAAEQDLRDLREVGGQQVKEKEATCRALNATMRELITCSQDFGEFLHSVGPAFVPKELDD